MQRALTAAGLAALLTLAGCGGPTAGSPDDPVTTAASGSPTTDPTGRPPSADPTTPVADPEHAVDPPTRRTERLRSPDLLVRGKTRLSDELVDAIRAMPDVTGVERISLAEVPIENRLLTVAAVDPATYRLYTPLRSADFLTEWQRVAGGELALLPSLAKRVPIDADGYLRLGSSKDAQRVHVGAYAPQIPQLIDAVVNERWGEDLGIADGNALIVSTGIASPQSVQKPLERLAGDGASVQSLDAVARYGLDPDVVQTAVVVGTIADAVGTFRYTVLGGGHIAPDPAWVSSHIATHTVPILGSITCNRLIFPQLEAALRDVQAQGLADKIHPGEYAGCYYPRFIAGSTTLSNHAFGLALDLNTPGNQRGTAGEIDRGVVAIFKHWGFTWGGDWRYTDPMHFEMNALVDPR